MALDESNENDTVIEKDGLTFIIEKDLLEKTQPIELDYLLTPQGEGFNIKTGLKQSSDCGGCTSC